MNITTSSNKKLVGLAIVNHQVDFNVACGPFQNKHEPDET